jgi:hypothetical protein
MRTQKIAAAILLTSRRALGILSLGVFLTACSMDTSVKDISTFGLNDFAKSEVIVSGNGTANGTVMSYSIRLKNSNNKLVEGHVPTITKVSGSASLGGCSRSDVNGLSFCTLSSTVIGTVRISVNNIKINLQKDIIFAPVQGTGGQTISGAIGQVTGGSGYKITSSVGAEFSQTRYESGSGYKVYSTIQGDIASRFD